MSHNLDRLQAIVQTAERLIMAAPTETTSRLWSDATRLSHAASRMARVLQSSPGVMPTIKSSRFLIAAEGAASTMETLIGLTGHGHSTDEHDPEAEESLGRVVDALVEAADAARREALASLKSDIEASADAVAAWHAEPEGGALTTAPRLRSDDLADAFTSVQAPVSVPAVIEPKGRGILRFLPIRKGSAFKREMRDVQDLTDSGLDDLLKRDANGHGADKVWTDHGDFDSEFRARNPRLAERGLTLDIGRQEATFALTNEAPKIMTPKWQRIADAASGDWKALHRALAHRENPEFRAALRSEMVRVLNEMEAQAQAGVPLPKDGFKDPVIAAAVTATFSAMGYTKLRNRIIGKNPEFDPFEIRKNLSAIMKKNHGLMVQPTEDGKGLVLMTMKSADTPVGVSAALNESVSSLKSQVAYLPYKFGEVQDEEGVPLRISAAAVLAVPDILKSVEDAISAYGKGKDYEFSTNEYLDLSFAPDPSGDVGAFRIHATEESLRHAEDMEGYDDFY